jgi:pilus assembly protein TadC
MIPTEALVWSAIAGVALVLVVRELLPSRPKLGAGSRPAPTLAVRTGAWPEMLGARLLRSAGGLLRVPRQDLALLGQSPAAHTGRQVLYALGAMLFPQLLTALLALVGATPPLVFPVIVSLVLAAIGWLGVDVEVRKEAARAREEFRFATASFLDRAALTRAADAGAADALYRTAAVGDGWALERIREALEASRLSGTSPWEILAQLAHEIGVPELARPADTFALAGDAGATVYSTLRAQAQALRTAMLTDNKAAANRASEALVIPVAGLAIVFLIFIGYPALSRILSV